VTTHHPSASVHRPTSDRVAPEILAEVAVEAVRAVSDLVLRGFRAGVAVETKRDPRDVVTEIDRRSEEMIREVIADRTPGATVIGEESGIDEGDHGGLRWYVDPIDGTNNYVTGFPYFAVSVAAEVDGELVVGAVLDPVNDELFLGGPDGLTLNGAPVATSEAVSHGVLLTSQPFQGYRAADADLRDLLDLCSEIGIVRNPGSYALQLAHVAAGRATAALELYAAAPWDVAAGFALVRAGGGSVTALAEPWEGYGSWGSHSFLARHDGRADDGIVARLHEFLERGTVPNWGG
jgi:myo-inositol-1(or 4)-monophosphatase